MVGVDTARLLLSKLMKIRRVHGGATSMTKIDAEALAVLQRALGPTAAFRDGQLDAIRTLAQDRGRLLVVQRTGWGKSAVYFVATRILRDKGAGPTIIVSPLLALMRDQISAASAYLHAVTINSSNTDDWEDIERELAAGKVDVLLVSPERFNNPDFRRRLLPPLLRNIGLFVVDEAHCISDWGHDFRPDYRRIVSVLERIPYRVPVLCTTATANNRVVTDIRQQLGDEVVIKRGSLNRESLSLHAVRMPTVVERLAWLAERVPDMPGSGIVYCLTVSDTQRVADWLCAQGIAAASYSGETDSQRRIELEGQLKANELKVLAATSALGMGYDKPDLSFVIHFQSPDSPVAYYQQVGRAGRAVDSAEVVLLWSQRDEEIWRYFLETSLPIQWHAEQVVEYLEAAGDWVGQREIEMSVNMPSSRLAGLLKVLDVEGAIEKDRSTYRRTLRPWKFDSERIERVRDARLAEHQAMRDYATTSECRMLFLRRALDDDDATACGRCDNCFGKRFDRRPRKSTVGQALSYIRRRPIDIDPRRQWVGHRRGRISKPLEVGRALCYLTDPGWGDQLSASVTEGARIDDELVDASASLIKEWLPGFEGTIAYVPSSDNGDPVRDFAERLASTLDVRVGEFVIRTRETEPQCAKENSAQQLLNVDGAFALRDALPGGPILLVDDFVDSRWTMTVVGELVQSHGAGPVYPFAVGKTKG